MARAPEARLFLEPGEIVVDSFAGGGGASKGIELALGRGPDIAINHDAEAIALHAANHPESEHYTEDVWQVDPVEACRDRKVGLMWLSPDCKHFSKAKGGKPVSPRVRGLAWVAVRWAKAVRPRIIVLENVEEFQTWGPVDRATNRPCPRRRGLTFKRFVGRLRGLGYVVEWRELRACDYGAPTIRKRLFLVARCDGQPIAWPAPTHGKGRALPWRTAAECIDFALPCPSIFTRKKPLAENTLKRIGAGLRRFVFEADRPFIVGVGGRMSQSAPRSVNQPYQTITAKADAALVVPHLVTYHGAKHDGDDRTDDLARPLPVQDASNRFGLVAPLLVPIDNGSNGAAGAQPGGDPLSTITAEARHALVAPYLTPVLHAGDERVYSLEEPARTITGAHRGEQALIAPLLIPRYGEDPDPRRGGGAGQAPRALPIDKPMPTIVPTGNGASLVAGFLAKHYGGHETPGTQLDRPISTVTTQDHHHLVTSSLVSLRGTEPSHLHGESIEEPMRTVSAGGLHAAEVRTFLIAYYGAERDGGSLFDPVRTLSTKDRFGLVMVDGQEYQLADIGMRMLAPRELYRAQGFPDSYRIDVQFNGKPLSKTAQVRMCGNSVCPDVAAAIITANVGTTRTVEAAA